MVSSQSFLNALRELGLLDKTELGQLLEYRKQHPEHFEAGMTREQEQEFWESIAASRCEAWFRTAARDQYALYQAAVGRDGQRGFIEWVVFHGEEGFKAWLKGRSYEPYI